MTVYFARATALDQIKIGYVQETSAALAPAAVAKRLRQVSRLVGSPMELLATMAGGRFVERWLHIRHGAAALGGEWFKPSPELQADIDRLCGGQSIAGVPTPPPYPHHRNYRWWQVVIAHGGRPFWADRAVKPRDLARAFQRCRSAA